MADGCGLSQFQPRLILCLSPAVGQGKTSGVVKILKDLDAPWREKDLLLVEDILDSGPRTLYYLREILTKRNPASIKIATLLDKLEGRWADIHPLCRFHRPRCILWWVRPRL